MTDDINIIMDTEIYKHKPKDVDTDTIVSIGTQVNCQWKYLKTNPHLLFSILLHALSHLQT